MQKFNIPVRMDVDMVVEIFTTMEVEANSLEEAQDLIEDLGQNPQILAKLKENQVKIHPKYEINMDYLDKDLTASFTENTDETTGGVISYLEVKRD